MVTAIIIALAINLVPGIHAGYIQDAINAASDGQNIVIPPGGYYESQITPADKRITLSGYGVTIYPASIAFRFGASANCVIEGFAIDGRGIASGMTFTGYVSGDCSVLIRDVEIKNCHASYGGAAIYCSRYAQPHFRQCFFHDNRTEQEIKNSLGGVMYCTQHARPVFTDCRFEDNYAILTGGACYHATNAVAKYIRCSFIGNTSDGYGGAIATYYGCPGPNDLLMPLPDIPCPGDVDTAVILMDCYFNGNSAGIYGDNCYYQHSVISGVDVDGYPQCHDGDVNCDGAITSGDAQLAFQFAMGYSFPKSLNERYQADKNADGVTTARDAQLIFQEGVLRND